MACNLSSRLTELQERHNALLRWRDTAVAHMAKLSERQVDADNVLLATITQLKRALPRSRFTWEARLRSSDGRLTSEEDGLSESPDHPAQAVA